MPNNKRINSTFYQRDVNIVARELLGKIFVKVVHKKLLKGMIVEVEAYDGLSDEASHSFNGPTKRNQLMFQHGGLLYVYFTYGMHYCANIVTGKENFGSAVLIRAVEPLNYLDLLCYNRFQRYNCTAKELINLTNGPAKFCQAFGINKEINGADLTGDSIYLLNAKKIHHSKIIATTRIGIKKSVDLPWRYYIKDNPFVSK